MKLWECLVEPVFVAGAGVFEEGTDVPDPPPVEPLFVAGAGEFVFEPPVEPVPPLVEPVFVAGAGVYQQRF